MLAIGGAAGAASFTHVHDLAAAHRQGGWLAWADAIVLELMSIASGLEIRRRRRIQDRVAVPATVLVCAVLLSLAAQVIQAEPTPIGWIAAAVPAAGFLTMVKIALGYHPTPAADRDAGQSAPDTRTDPTVSGTVTRTRPPTSDRPTSRTAPDRTGDTADARALLPAATTAAAHLAATGTPLTRAALADALRTDGYAISTARASTLVKILKARSATSTTAGSTTADSTDI